MSCSEDTSRKQWGEINIEEWKETPCIKNRTATEEDVESGIAVFYIQDSQDLRTIDMSLPRCAIHVDEETKERTPVIVIQAEESQNQKLIGYRLLDGGNGICLQGELTFLDGPNEEFVQTK